MQELVHSEALLFCVLGCRKTLSSWAAWWAGAQSMLVFVLLLPSAHAWNLDPLTIFFWGRAQRNMPQTLNLGIVSLKANIWFRTAWIERNWWGLGVVRSESKLTPDCCKQLAQTALKIKVHKAKWITEANFKKQRPYRRANPDLQRPRASWHRPNTLALSCLIQHYW